MNSVEVINIILEETGYKAATFAAYIGVPRHLIADVKCGKTKSISVKLQKAICGKFPQFNPTWVLTGEGPIHIENFQTNNFEIQKIGNVDNSVVGNNSSNGVNGDLVSKLLDELAAQREELSAQRKQNDELIALLKSQIGK